MARRDHDVRKIVRGRGAITRAGDRARARRDHEGGRSGAGVARSHVAVLRGDAIDLAIAQHPAPRELRHCRGELHVVALEERIDLTHDDVRNAGVADVDAH